MTDITRLINDLNHRMHSAQNLGFDFLFLKLDDLGVIADTLETALRANTAQADHAEQLQDRYNKLAAENAALKQFPEQIVKFIGGLGTSEMGSDTKEKIELAANRIKTPVTDAYLGRIKADGVEEWVSSRGGRWNGTTEEALKFAKQLREGGKV
ncbi:TPA: hypothetical protein L2B17_005190 [Klebsiella oxytoca]|nr:hypothetical protein [Klebsiella oxytoca]HBN2674631.1 hypothetical protein [Klebsiella oxytoca]HBN2800110.1 hypothetical protein [Klebsiella oxytoca]